MKETTVKETTENLEKLQRAANEQAAGIMYTSYCKAVGGVAFNGDPLPSWEEFSSDENKTKQSEAWIKSADSILQFFVNTYIEISVSSK